jgi:catechol 2,3-dioxygenase-like lactoylglutathione lyase family enzyme
MIDHLSISVTDYPKSRAFYLAALAPLGYTMCMEFTSKDVPSLPHAQVGGLGADGKPDLWLAQSDVGTSPTHIAIVAKSRAAVDGFYRAALEAGAKSNGEPGIRAQYHPTYYGAFVIDLNGHNLEAVCHTP